MGSGTNGRAGVTGVGLVRVIAWGVFYMIVAAGLWWGIHKWMVPATRQRYLIDLVEGPFQYVCTFAFCLGVAMAFHAIYDCLMVEAAGARQADGIAERLRKEWQVGAEGGAEGSRRQGLDVLRVMGELGLSEGEKSTSQLRGGGLYLGRIHRLGLYLFNTRDRNVAGLMDINGELSALDGERVGARFTLLRYLVYLIPVIGFLGTVYGISMAMNAIGASLQEVNNLKGFMTSLQAATKALQVAFDTTLLALVYSGLLTLMMSMATWLYGDFLARLDTWMIDNLLSYVTEGKDRDEGLQQLAGTLRGAMRGTEEAVRKMGEDLKEAVLIVHDSVDQYGKETAEATKQSAARAADIGHGVMTLGDTLAKAQASQDLGAKALRVMAGELTGANALLRRTADACDAVRGSQEAGLGEVRDLAAAVRGLPELSHSLEAASTKIRDASGSLASLGGLADRFGALDGLTDRVGEATGALDSIRRNTEPIAAVRDALAKDVGGNGDHHRVDAISAIQQMNVALKGMNEALAEQINNMNKVNAAQIAGAMRNVADANKLLAGGLEGLQAQMGALNRSFMELSSDIRNIASGCR